MTRSWREPLSVVLTPILAAFVALWTAGADSSVGDPCAPVPVASPSSQPGASPSPSSGPSGTPTVDPGPIPNPNPDPDPDPDPNPDPDPGPVIPPECISSTCYSVREYSVSCIVDGTLWVGVLRCEMSSHFCCAGDRSENCEDMGYPDPPSDACVLCENWDCDNHKPL